MTESDDRSYEWRDLGEQEEEAEEVQIEEYDLTSSPNDFNTRTIVDFIESGAVRIPGFQRNYVWDIKRASKLIESLILGLPVPQVFLYEESRNTFLVIDGQQRLLTIYFFAKQRFPRRNKRAELRRMLTLEHVLPDEVIANDDFFETFNLRLPELAPGRPNRFARLNYARLGDYKTQFDLRTIRNIIVKQIHPQGDDSSIYEMFHRLNSGGVNLTPQEIRASLYHSELFDALSLVNLTPSWRSVVGRADPDIGLRDAEILLRAVAMWKAGGEYGSSMAQFLNSFAKQAKKFTPAEVADVTEHLGWFLSAVDDLKDADRVFVGRSGKFSVTFFEAAFAAACELKDEGGETFSLSSAPLLRLRDDAEFAGFSQAQSNKKANVTGRLSRARAVLTNG